MGTIAAIEDAARTNTELKNFLAQVASEATGETEGDSPQRTVVLEAVGVVLLYAIWRLAKIGLDRVQSMTDMDTVRKQADLVQELVDRGHTLAEAKAVVVALLQEIRQRSKDDPVLATVNALYKASGGEP
ncbi:hypothetical protein ACFL5Z_19910 [Planctomycetota bacterium]